MDIGDAAISDFVLQNGVGDHAARPVSARASAPANNEIHLAGLRKV
jgi:hypothetical protein